MNEIISDLIVNKTRLEAVDVFNREYGLRAITICPELINITINVIYHYESKHLLELNLNPNDVFAYFFSYKTSPKYAEIIVNEENRLKQKISEESILAAIAHEIGHIISVENHGDCYKELVAEVLSDDYACKIGLRKQLIRLLQELKSCGDYYDYQLRWFETRIELLERFPTVDDLSTIAKMALAIG